MTGLLQRVEKNLRDHRLLQRGQMILVAVSGGLDSMALLQILHELASRHRWQLTVAHFNHRLRGRNSDADERLVRRSAAALKWPVVVERAEVKRFAQKSKLSIEMAARKLRHEFLARTAGARGIRVVALAHHADDQVELFFLRVLRGAGGDGLAGMKRRSPSPADANIILIRPLLDFEKSELSAFGHKKRIRFREDATNLSTDFLRNRIRHELLPLLRKKYQPGLNRAVLRLMEIVGAESEMVGETAKRFCRKRGDGRQIQGKNRTGKGKPEAPGAGSDDFNDLPRAVQRRILQRRLIELGLTADFELVEQLREVPGRPVSVAHGLSVSRNAAGGVEWHSSRPREFNANERAVDLSGRAGRADFGGRQFRWQIQPQKKILRHSFSGGTPPVRELFDADRVGRRITLRHWRPGDRFQPIGLPLPAKLQDLFTNRKIPGTRRRELIVATAETGEIFWVEQLRIGEHFKLTPQTRRRLVWRWRSLAGGSGIGGKP